MTTFIVLAVVKIALVIFLLLTGVAYMTWLERKVVGHIQNRWRPTRVGRMVVQQQVFPARLAAGQRADDQLRVGAGIIVGWRAASIRYAESSRDCRQSKWQLDSWRTQHAHTTLVHYSADCCVFYLSDGGFRGNQPHSLRSAGS